MFNLANLTSTYRGKMIVKAYQPWVKPGSQVLDIGCGNGVVSRQLANSLQIKLTGCDIDNYLLEKINFVKMTQNHKLPFKNNRFQFSMFNDVLHHVPEIQQPQLIKEALRVAQEVAIFEVEPTPSGIAADWLINKIHNFRMKIPFTFRQILAWQALFTSLGVKFQTKRIDRPLFYPFSHVAFLLSE